MREMSFHIEIRKDQTWSADQVRDSRLADIVDSTLRRQYAGEVLAQRSEVEQARDDLIGVTILTPSEIQQVEERISGLEHRHDPVRTYLENFQREGDDLIDREVSLLGRRFPGFDRMFNLQLHVSASEGIALRGMDDLGAALRGMTRMGRFMQAVGLAPRPRYEVGPSFVLMTATCMLRGEPEALAGMARGLHDAFRQLGKVHEFSAELRPERMPQPSFEEALANRTPLPPLGTEALGLIEAVGHALKAGDVDGAFDAAQAFGELVRRAPALARVLEGTPSCRMSERFGGDEGRIDRSLPRLVATMRGKGDADGLSELFFQGRTSGGGVLGLLHQMSSQRFYDTTPSRALAKPFEAAFGPAANARLHFTAFWQDRLDAPTPADRARQAERQVKLDRLHRAEAAEAEDGGPKGPGLR